MDSDSLDQAIREFADSNPTFRTHGFFDIFEALSDFLTSAHLNLVTSDKPLNAIASGIIQSFSPKSNLNKSDAKFQRITSEQSFEELRKVSQTSPFFTSISGSIDTDMICENCGREEVKKDSFMSLNFKLLSMETVQQIRKRFQEEGYKEGLVTKNKKTKAWNVFNFFSKKNTAQPVLTIRDYLCYLNLVQTHNFTKQCEGCKTEANFIVSKLLNKSPEILIVGFVNGDAQEEETAVLDFRIDLEFDISPFVSQAQPAYRLVTVVASEHGPLGIRSDVVYSRGLSESWIRIDT